MVNTADESKHDEPESEGERERSTIGFPYLDLDDAVQVTKAVHDVGGSSCEWEQLAAKLGAAAKGGGFRMRVLTAKTFGFLSYDKGTVTLSDIGMRAADAQQEKAARVDAFLSVPLYKRVYDQFKGNSLPGTAGLENFMVSAGVAPKQKDKARQVFQRSAKQAGFFDLSADRLTLPSIRPGTRQSTPDAEDRHTDPDQNRQRGKNGGGGGGDGHHPLIEGLIKALPRAGEEWTIEARRKWLQAAAMNFDYVYTDPKNEEKSIKVSVE